MIKISQTSNVNIDRCNINNVNYAKQGAFLDISEESSVLLSNSIFQGIQLFSFFTVQIDMSSITGGALYVSQLSQIIIVNTIFEKIKAFKSGVFQVGDLSRIEISGCVFNSNMAMTNGVFKIAGDSYFNIQNSQFIENLAEVSCSIGQIIQISQPSMFKNVVFDSNKAFILENSKGKKGMEILSCNYQVMFDSCTFKDNLSKLVTPNLYLVGATNVQFDKSTFSNSKNREQDNINISGNFIQIVAESKVTIKNTNFIRGYGMLGGGALFIQGESSVLIENSKFIENKAARKGGAICTQSFQQLIITKNSIFDSNEVQYESGDAIYADNSVEGIIIEDTKFISNSASNFLDAYSIATIEIKNSQFQLNPNFTIIKNKTGGVSLSQISNLLIDKSSFINLHGFSENGGGALRFSQLDNNAMTSHNFIINDCLFQNSTNINGGAISLINTQKVEITGKSKFIGNTAFKNGGAIILICSDIRLECSLKIEGALFKDNLAMIDGGAIKWNFIEPIMSNLHFENNRALVYGDNLASVPKYLIRIMPNKLNLKSLNQANNLPASNSISIFNENNYLTYAKQFGNISAAQSGGKLNLYFVMVDKYGTIVKSDNSSYMQINADQMQNSNYVSLIETTTQIGCQNGIFFVNDMVFIGQPDSTQNYNIPDNREVLKLKSKMQSSENYQQSFSMLIEMRGCIEGEQYLPNGKCNECPSGTYLLYAPQKPTLCQECLNPTQAKCLGGNQLFPMPGYWRSSIYSDIMHPCRNDEACLGGMPQNHNSTLLGACETGYQNILCADCQIGYSRTGSAYKCSKCPSTSDNIIRIFFLFIALLAIIIILIRSSLQGSTDKKNILSVFLRIVINHLQLLTLTASFGLEWPSNLQQFYTLMKPVSEVTTQFLSIECMLDQRNDLKDKFMPVFYQKMIILSLLPFAIFLLSYISWIIIYKIRSRKTTSIQIEQSVYQDNFNNASFKQIKVRSLNLKGSDEFDEIGENQKVEQMLTIASQNSQTEMMQGRIVSTIIIVLFLVHSHITAAMFNAFNCQDIDGTLRLYEDLEILCYTSEHKLFGYAVALPSLILWGLGIPTFGLILIVQNRKDLNLRMIKEKYGFLYNGYRYPQSYYWELVIIYRKIVMIFIQVFLAQLESLSLLSSAVTVYCGLYYIASASFRQDQKYQQLKLDIYQEGHIPAEDEALKHLVIEHYNFIQEVEKKEIFNSDLMKKNTFAIEELIFKQNSFNILDANKKQSQKKNNNKFSLNSAFSYSIQSKRSAFNNRMFKSSENNNKISSFKKHLKLQPTEDIKSALEDDDSGLHNEDEHIRSKNSMYLPGINKIESKEFKKEIFELPKLNHLAAIPFDDNNYFEFQTSKSRKSPNSNSFKAPRNYPNDFMVNDSQISRKRRDRAISKQDDQDPNCIQIAIEDSELPQMNNIKTRMYSLKRHLSSQQENAIKSSFAQKKHDDYESTSSINNPQYMDEPNDSSRFHLQVQPYNIGNASRRKQSEIQKMKKNKQRWLEEVIQKGKISQSRENHGSKHPIRNSKSQRENTELDIDENILSDEQEVHNVDESQQ